MPARSERFGEITRESAYVEAFTSVGSEHDLVRVGAEHLRADELDVADGRFDAGVVARELVERDAVALDRAHERRALRSHADERHDGLFDARAIDAVGNWQLAHDLSLRVEGVRLDAEAD